MPLSQNVTTTLLISRRSPPRLITLWFHVLTCRIPSNAKNEPIFGSANICPHNTHVESLHPFSSPPILSYCTLFFHTSSTYDTPLQRETSCPCRATTRPPPPPASRPPVQRQSLCCSCTPHRWPAAMPGSDKKGVRDFRGRTVTVDFRGRTVTVRGVPSSGNSVLQRFVVYPGLQCTLVGE
jgi:hypothetical protein